jgi:hypothetical protein
MNTRYPQEEETKEINKPPETKQTQKQKTKKKSNNNNSLSSKMEQELNCNSSIRMEIYNF